MIFLMKSNDKLTKYVNMYHTNNCEYYYKYSHSILQICVKMNFIYLLKFSGSSSMNNKLSRSGFSRLLSSYKILKSTIWNNCDLVPPYFCPCQIFNGKLYHILWIFNLQFIYLLPLSHFNTSTQSRTKINSIKCILI